jgi:hypothetical protein
VADTAAAIGPWHQRREHFVLLQDIVVRPDKAVGLVAFGSVLTDLRPDLCQYFHKIQFRFHGIFSFKLIACDDYDKLRLRLNFSL